MYDSKIGRWLSVDPEREFFSSYLGMGNNPIGLSDSDGGSVNSTHTDEEGNVVAVYNDGDFGVYKHSAEEISKWRANGGKLAGGKFMGSTMYWDEFVRYGTDGTKLGVGGHINFNRTMVDYMLLDWHAAAKLHFEEKVPFWSNANIAIESGPGGYFDIKEQIGHYEGYLFQGFYFSGRSLGNYLAGANAAATNLLPHGIWQPITKYSSGVVHQRSLFPWISDINGSEFGEIPYAERMINMGYNDVKSGWWGN